VKENQRKEISFVVNEQRASSDVAPDTPLLYVLRNDLKLKGTRFGCGEGLCGACTVLVDGVATLSCDTPVEAVAGKDVLTIEGVLADETNPVLKRLQETNAWQCGYCTAGIVMKATEILHNQSKTNLSKTASSETGHRASLTAREKLAISLDANLCRCGAHPRILDALVPLFERKLSNT